jgi:hypothetical protein
VITAFVMIIKGINDLRCIDHYERLKELQSHKTSIYIATRKMAGKRVMVDSLLDMIMFYLTNC